MGVIEGLGTFIGLMNNVFCLLFPLMNKLLMQTRSHALYPFVFC